MHLYMAGLEDGSYLHCERRAAVIAFIGTDARALAFQLANSLTPAAVWALRAIGPQLRLNVGIGGLFVVECRAG